MTPRPEESGDNRNRGPGETIDAYRPAAIAELIEASGVAKAHLGTLQTLTLAVLAGAFIAFGAMLFTTVPTNSGLGFGPDRLLGGAAFSLGPVYWIAYRYGRGVN